MSKATDALDRLINQYLTGGLAFLPFWSAFMDAYADGGLSDTEELAYEPAYEIVYMGTVGEIAPEDRALGLLDEAHVKAELKAFRTRRSQQSSA